MHTKREQIKRPDKKKKTGGQFHSLMFNYKIGSTCIANRVKRVLPSLISEDQTGFMANKYIGDNI